MLLVPGFQQAGMVRFDTDVLVKMHIQTSQLVIVFPPDGLFLLLDQGLQFLEVLLGHFRDRPFKSHTFQRGTQAEDLFDILFSKSCYKTALVREAND